jgi:putative peptide zinc metalloprotease protein
MKATMRQVNEHARWKLNPAITFHSFDGASGELWMLELDDSHGRAQRQTVTAKVHEALRMLMAPSTEAALFHRLRTRGWSEASLRKLRVVLFEQGVAKRIVIDADQGPTEAPEQERKPPYMLFMLPLLPAAWVNVLARPLSILFSPLGLVVGSALTIVGQVAMVRALVRPRPFSTPTSAEVLSGMAIAFAVLFVHELGHAAAAWRAGARKVRVGVGWYVLFPVAWADLSEAWRFPAHTRVLVDVAGVFVQSLAVTALMACYAVSGHALLLACAASATVSILWNLNPLLRLDGYWVLGDLLGSTNLRADASASFRAYWNRLTPRGLHFADASRRSLTRRASAVLAVYGFVAAAFFVWVSILAASRFAHAVLVGLPRYYVELASRRLADRSTADLFVTFGGLGWRLVLIFFLGRHLAGLVLQARSWRKQPRAPSMRKISNLTITHHADATDR